MFLFFSSFKRTSKLTISIVLFDLKCLSNFLSLLFMSFLIWLHIWFHIWYRLLYMVPPLFFHIFLIFTKINKVNELLISLFKFLNFFFNNETLLLINRCFQTKNDIKKSCNRTSREINTTVVSATRNKNLKQSVRKLARTRETPSECLNKIWTPNLFPRFQNLCLAPENSKVI